MGADASEEEEGDGGDPSVFRGSDFEEDTALADAQDARCFGFDLFGDRATGWALDSELHSEGVGEERLEVF
jgi:hypothetical protein